MIAAKPANEDREIECQQSECVVENGEHPCPASRLKRSGPSGPARLDDGHGHTHLLQNRRMDRMADDLADGADNRISISLDFQGGKPLPVARLEESWRMTTPLRAGGVWLQLWDRYAPDLRSRR